MHTAASYRQWLDYTGFYLRNYSHGDRYKTFANKISSAGLNVCVAYDFIQDNRGGIDLQGWRSHGVYEMGGDLTYRLKVTSDALKAIGAPRLAEKVLAAKDSPPFGMLQQAGGEWEPLMSMMQEQGPEKLMEGLRESVARAMPDDAQKMGMKLPGDDPVPPDGQIESREQLEHLLSEYVAAHQTKLQKDVDKHGDPRTEPDFTHEKRMQEIDQMRDALYERERQVEEAEKLQEYVLQMNKKLRGDKKGKIGSLRRKLVDITRRYQDREPQTLVPEMRQAMMKAKQLQEEFSDLFFPPATNNAELQKRIRAIGEYQLDPQGQGMELRWPSVESLKTVLGGVSLCMQYPKDDDDALSALLTVVEDFVRRANEWSSEVEAEVMNNFREIYEPQMADWEFEDYELDESGKVTDDCVRKNIEGGTMYFSLSEWTPDQVYVSLFLNVTWDGEHGSEHEWLVDRPE